MLNFKQKHPSPELYKKTFALCVLLSLSLIPPISSQANEAEGPLRSRSTLTLMLTQESNLTTLDDGTTLGFLSPYNRDNDVSSGKNECTNFPLGFQSLGVSENFAAYFNTHFAAPCDNNTGESLFGFLETAFMGALYNSDVFDFFWGPDFYAHLTGSPNEYTSGPLGFLGDSSFRFAAGLKFLAAYQIIPHLFVEADFSPRFAIDTPNFDFSSMALGMDYGYGLMLGWEFADTPDIRATAYLGYQGISFEGSGNRDYYNGDGYSEDSYTKNTQSNKVYLGVHAQF